MIKLEPQGLKEIPRKPFNPKLQKVEEIKLQPPDVSVNPIDVLRLLVRKKFENIAFSQLEISTGKAVAVTGGGGVGLGLLLSINYPLLLTGSPVEIVKFIVAIAGILVAWFWKN